MFFVFGTTDRAAPRGLVVDSCPACLDLSWFQLVDHRRVWHAYFIPLGRGQHLYTSLCCTRCRSDFPLGQKSFNVALPESARAELSLEEGLSRTNPALARRFADVDALLGEARAVYRDPIDEASRTALADAVQRLKSLERRGIDTARWVERLRNWARLSASRRELLLAELRGFHDAASR